jgi:hypothetical protein
LQSWFHTGGALRCKVCYATVWCNLGSDHGWGEFASSILKIHSMSINILKHGNIVGYRKEKRRLSCNLPLLCKSRATVWQICRPHFAGNSKRWCTIRRCSRCRMGRSRPIVVH